jgi:hypothetical protein
MTLQLAILLACASSSLAASVTTSVPVLLSPPQSASTPIAGNFQSFSIEFAFWADFAG